MLKADRTVLWAGLFFACASAATIVVGHWHHRVHSDRYVAEYQEELRTIGEMRVESLLEWRQDRLRESQLIATGLIGEYVQQGAAQYGPNLGRWDPGLMERIRQRLRYWAEQQGYEDLLILGLDGTLHASSGLKADVHIGTALLALATKAAESGATELGEVSLCEYCKNVHVDVARALTDRSGSPVAVLVTRVDPERDLFPRVQRWPTPSASGETLLAQRSGDQVVLLNSLRHSGASPMSLSFPISQQDLPAVQAASGRTGIFRGRDYRGVEVMADLSGVGDSPWKLVTKVDNDEVMAQVNSDGLVTALVVFLVVLAFGALTLLLTLHGKFRLERLRASAERARHLHLEEVRVTLYSIGDAVIASDPVGNVTRMNGVAEQLTGWSEADAVGRPLSEVFHIVNEETGLEVENPVERVLREKKVVGLANHTLLISADGTRRPIADSGAPILDDVGQVCGVVLVFRDQTAERQAEEATARAQAERDAERQNLRAVMDAAPIPLLVFDERGNTTIANEAARSALGTVTLGKLPVRCGDFVRCVHRMEADEGCGHSPECPECSLNAAILSVTGEVRPFPDWRRGSRRVVTPRQPYTGLLPTSNPLS